MTRFTRYLFSESYPLNSDQCPNHHGCQWWPVTTASDFRSLVSSVLALVVVFFISVLAFAAVICCCLHWTRQRYRPRSEHKNRNPATILAAETVLFSPMMQLTGEAECTICLTEFQDGDELKVLQNCRHGFHTQCIIRWLTSRDSCPTCRTCCFTEQSPTRREVKDSGECQGRRDVEG